MYHILETKKRFRQSLSLSEGSTGAEGAGSKLTYVFVGRLWFPNDWWAEASVVCPMCLSVELLTAWQLSSSSARDDRERERQTDNDFFFFFGSFP